MTLIKKIGNHAKSTVLNEYNKLKFSYLKSNTILIYTLGKVGSSTIYHELKRISPFGNVLHVHFLSDEWLNNRLKKTNHYGNNRKAADKVVQYLADHPRNKKKIITLVREPVSRELSNFMQNSADFIDGDITSHPIDALQQAYMEKMSYDYTFNWFDSEFKSYTGFDVFSTPFDTEKGYAVYHHNGFDILVIKLEKLNECYAECLNKFLGLSNMQMKKAYNQSASKQISNVYSQLKERIKFPKSYLEEVYRHQYVKHFYTTAEIQKFIAKHSIEK